MVARQRAREGIGCPYLVLSLSGPCLLIHDPWFQAEVVSNASTSLDAGELPRPTQYPPPHGPQHCGQAFLPGATLKPITLRAVLVCHPRTQWHHVV